jgi:hypothetical protein
VDAENKREKSKFNLLLKKITEQLGQLLNSK